MYKPACVFGGVRLVVSPCVGNGEGISQPVRW